MFLDKPRLGGSLALPVPAEAGRGYPMKSLLIVTAAIEVGTALVLLAAPWILVRLLFGVEISGASVPLGRVAGAALLALSCACWLGKFDALSAAARGLVIAMLLYNVGTAVILGIAGAQLRPAGIALWPAVALHAAMSAWCIAALGRKSLTGVEIQK